MDTPDSVAAGTVAAGSLTTVYAEAATDSGDVIEWRPGGDVRHWHDSDVTQWPDEDNDSSLTAKGDVTLTNVTPTSVKWGRFEAEPELTNSSVVPARASDVTNHSREAPCLLSSGDSSEDSSNISSESHHVAAAGQAVNDDRHLTVSNPAAKTLETVQTNAGSTDTVNAALNAVEAAAEAVDTVNSVDTANAAVNAVNTAADAVDEIDAVHPRLSSGAARRRRSSYPAFACDTCCRDTGGWQDCVDHAYRSGHGLAAHCALCRLPAVRCRRRGRPGVWHRCVVVDTVRKLGAGNVAALMAGSHLTAPRPWRLSCGECGASFAAKTARLVHHVVERGHSVRRHCERCLFPVFVFGLNDERREMHVCVGNSAWLRSEEGALLATAAESDPPNTTRLNGAVGEERGDRRGRSGGASNHLPPQATHTGLGRHHPNGDATRHGEDITSDFHHRHSAFRTANGTASGHNHGHRNGGSGGVGLSSNREVVSGMAVPNGSAVSSGGGRLVPLTSEERTPSCVAI